MIAATKLVDVSWRGSIRRNNGRLKSWRARNGAENTFEKIGREWFAKRAEIWDPAHAGRILSRLERDIFQLLGGRPITDVEPPELLGVLRRIEARGVRETVRRARQDYEQIFDFAIASGMCQRNPAAGLSRALAPVKKAVHFAAVTDPQKFSALLRTMDGYQGTITVCSALRLAPLFAVRPGELRKAKWTDFDLHNAEWRFVASKTHPDHIVPLSRQALEILHELRKVNGVSEYVFPGARSMKRPMSDNAVLAALRSMGFPADVVTGHGFRASFRTIGDEVLKFRVNLLEHQIAHEVTWSAYVRLLSVKRPEARSFYETEALRSGWSIRQLNRQIESQFYERIALSKNKAAMLKKAESAQPDDAVTPEEAIKDPFVLEFLDLKDEYSESDLEEALIRHLTDFLLELGDDFAFLGDSAGYVLTIPGFASTSSSSIVVCAVS